MPQPRLSDHCSLMARPGGPPPPRERPADCPKDGAYIKTTNAGGTTTLPGDPPFPIVFEGGDGNDSVTIVGGAGKGFIIDGGKGDDSLTIQDRATWFVGRLTPAGTLALGAFAIVMAAIAVLGWRALTPRDPRR